ncbi:U8 snoRNA-decapping enzyme-like [Falco rusticolus]|uniref:U8 snoRNA-decapping enzyme-like n=1 Tax=Falco rusticolus TaxID=120794 RepID=UPI0018866FDF|nr:U8 snoRNA-decapping enzyme-like [Falco rusticolus]
MWESRESPAALSRAEALGLHRNAAGNRAGEPGWRHACHVLLYAPLPAGSPPPGYAVLMQLRFDGRFGFPGGLVEPGEESLEAGLHRELLEELGPAAAELRLGPGHHCGARAWPAAGGGSGSDVGLVTHFYIRRLPLEQLVAIERGGPRSPEHGLEVQGLVRVPLGRGLPAFLRNCFAGDAREQLVGAFPILGIQPPHNEELVGDPQSQEAPYYKTDGRGRGGGGRAMT